MRTNTLLIIASLFSIFAFVLHLADDIVVGIEAGDTGDMVGGTAITLVWLCRTLLFAGRLPGYIVTLVGGLLATAVPYLHMSGKGVGGDFAKAPGAYFFICTLLLLALAGSFSVILSSIEIWNLWRGRRVNA